MNVILASTSPRRHELLSRTGIDFIVAPSSVVERRPVMGEAPGNYALDLARVKARSVAADHPGAITLAADTIVTVDAMILGKPENGYDAVRMLRLLRGREHKVYTGVVVLGRGMHQGLVASSVRMKAFSDAELLEYVGSGEPADKAGAYAVQGLGRDLVTAVAGCFENVMGLPVCMSQALLRTEGMLLPVATHCSHDIF
ncbi:MAG: Maf family protein [Chloroflexota bacterium]